MGFLTVLWRRLGFLLLVVFGVSIITFAISHMIPGDPARLLAGERASEAMVAGMRQSLGLDRPLPEQYRIYMLGLAHGDLGTSIRTGRPVAEDILAFFPATLELVIAALLFSIAIGVPLGVVSAVWRDRPIDHLVRTISVAGVSMPAFWLALMLIYLFYGQLGWLPGGGRIDLGASAAPAATGFYLIDALLAGDGQALWSAIRHLLLPALTLGFVHVGVVARQIRSALLDQLQQDYVRTARAGGLSAAAVVLQHALPNALIPSVTVLGLAFGDLLYGAVLTETVFAWPGMGSYVVVSIQALDFPAVMGFTVVVSFVYVLVNLAVDLVYLALDPRITGVG
ncbi:ABC transporter permease [Verminephrobacter eiseniae]|uniref:ABC transporter permease n=1 Tax=Verminephrobacter eiseniae TaxID=364317 RepID=UPI0022371E1D|nr:ABC transporter permease [Verminephrobacter eiseniae]MCW5260189.1 ABC transporter permease [Verminephrobacter eiseniae]